MIFSIFYILMLTGYSACGLLLGSYLIHYTNASSLDLGFVFMLQPLTTFCRVPICAYADRTQSHKRLLYRSLIWTSLSYIPFIAIPYLMENQNYQLFMTPRVCFWILVASQFSGSLGLCGCKALGDALSVNYAKRVGSDYSSYRKYGSISFGICSYLLGFINQDWILPDFVPAVITYVVSMFISGLLVYIWPDEYFEIVPETCQDEKKLDQIPRGVDLLRRLCSKISSIFVCRVISPGATKNIPKDIKLKEATQLTVRQQVSIFLLLLRRDLRIPLFSLLLFYGGLVGYAPQNFVFTYMEIVCNERKTCDPAKLAGMVMLVYCVMETSCYLMFNAFSKRLNYGVVLALTMASLSIHYIFYGLFLSKVSPYFFFIEALHGFEYSGSLCAGIELGYRFANEVELLIPELIQKGIISKNDDYELVKISLIATMTSFFTLVYDGFGTILGALLCGILIDKFSFTTTWIVIGVMATIGLIVVCLALVLGQCFKFKPKIIAIRDNY